MHPLGPSSLQLQAGPALSMPSLAHQAPPHLPGVVGLRLILGLQSVGPVEGQASPLPRGFVLFIRNHEQL